MTIKRIGIILGLLTVFALGKSCGSGEKPPQGPAIKIPGNVPIKIGNGHKRQLPDISKTYPLPGYSEPYVPPEGDVTISPKDPEANLEDVVNITYKKNGIVFEPGIVGAFWPSAIGLDTKLFYWNRFGITTGFLAGLNNISTVVSPLVGLSYRLDQIKYLRNTEAVFMYVPFSKVQLELGVRINL